ncbi:MAG: SDR family NAD(P)-dependent oxidoreductase [Saprospiraceae bacterium]|nr:SDR family NAD(P)-dependent oxidoreductase [Saprospiraceae bacterium]
MEKKKIALITGGSRGIGLALTKKLVNEKYEVWATCRDEGEEIKNCGAQPLYLDLNQVEEIPGFINKIINQITHLDLLIHNAALSATHIDLTQKQKNLEFGKLEFSGLEKMIRINSIVPVLLTQSLTSVLKNAHNPKVLMLSSRKGALSLVNKGGNYGYKGSKALLNMWSLLLAEDLRSDGICVCSVNPGHVRTAMGGEDAPLSTEESADHLYELIEEISMKNSGQLLHTNGQKHPY